MWWFICWCIFLVIWKGSGGLNKFGGGLKLVGRFVGILGGLKLVGNLFGGGLIVVGKGGNGVFLCIGVILGIGVKLGGCRNVWFGVFFCRCIGFILCKWEMGWGGNGNGGGLSLIGFGMREVGGGFFLRWIVLGECIGGDIVGNFFFGLKGGNCCIKGFVGFGKGDLLVKVFNSCFCWSWIGRNNFLIVFFCFWRFMFSFCRFFIIVLKGVGFYMWIVFRGLVFLSWFFIIVEVVIICNGFVGCGNNDVCEVFLFEVLLLEIWLILCLSCFVECE